MVMRIETRLTSNFAKVPVVAILRGITPESALEFGQALVAGGINVIEVPLNSPEPFASIEILRKGLSPDVVVGAGTVLSVSDVEAVAQAGGEIAVSPNCNEKVIKRAIELGLVPMPGAATVSESFAAYDCGARYIKLFPYSSLGAGYLSALKSVAPKDMKFIPVGGISPDDIPSVMKLGVSAVGLGNSLFDATVSIDEFKKRISKITAQYS